MKKVLITALAGAMMLTAACSSSWITEANNILKVALPAAINILNLVAVFNGKVEDNAPQQVTADFNNVEKLLNDYAAASTAAQPSAEAQLNAALATTQTDLQNIFSTVDVKDTKKKAEIAALVSFVLSEVTAVESLLPSPTGVSTKQTRRVLTARQFKKGYNSLMPEKQFKL